VDAHDDASMKGWVIILELTQPKENNSNISTNEQDRDAEECPTEDVPESFRSLIQPIFALHFVICICRDKEVTVI